MGAAVPLSVPPQRGRTPAGGRDRIALRPQKDRPGGALMPIRPGSKARGLTDRRRPQPLPIVKLGNENAHSV
jgi:hypothetical protein